MVNNGEMDPTPSLLITTVLIIDDSSEDRDVFRRFLQRDSKATYRILEAESGEQGINLLHQLQAKSGCDLVLLDFYLPDMDGLDILRQVKQQSVLSMPILILTGLGDEQMAAQALRLGAQDYITKQQLTAEVLQFAVRTALRQSKLQMQLSTYKAQQALIQDIALRIRQSLDLKEILTQAVGEVKQLLNCDRVIIYRFLPEGDGVVDVEAIQPGWPPILGEVINDPCLARGWIQQYLQGATTAIEDVRTADLDPCYQTLLARFHVRANLVIPIAIAHPPTSNEALTPPSGTQESGTQESETQEQTGGMTLWGLLIAHHCASARQWQSAEVQLLEQLAAQLAIAIQQAELYQQMQLSNQRLEATVQARTADLQQANESLKVSNQDLEQFAYIASHDLREPLRKVKSFSELLAKRYQGQLDETADRYIHYITDGAVRMQALINDLLAYSRWGKQDLVNVMSDLNQVLSRVLETLSDTIHGKKAIVQADTLPVLSIDALQIEQVFKNLIDNALKYSRDDCPPHITITAKKRDSDWLIAVQDNGIGIEAKFCDRIFILFQRLHTQSEYSGTGIGLAICKKIIERHGGDIGMTSTPHHGSTFWFTLPFGPS